MNITSSNFFMTNKINKNFEKNINTNGVQSNNTNKVQTPETVDNVDFDITNDDLKSLFDGVFNMISTNQADKTDKADKASETQPTDKAKEATSAEKAQFEKDCKELSDKLDADIKICEQKTKEANDYANKEMLLLVSGYEKETVKIQEDFHKLEKRFEELEKKSETGELTPEEENEKLKLGAKSYVLRDKLLASLFDFGAKSVVAFNGKLNAYKGMNYTLGSDLNKTMEDLQNRKSELNLSDNSILDSVSQKIEMHNITYNAFNDAYGKCSKDYSLKMGAIYVKSNSEIENSKLLQYATENWEKLGYAAQVEAGRASEISSSKLQSITAKSLAN